MVPSLRRVRIANSAAKRKLPPWNDLGVDSTARGQIVMAPVSTSRARPHRKT
jgi:hypothetical protein